MPTPQCHLLLTRCPDAALLVALPGTQSGTTMIMEAPLGSPLDTLAEELDAGAKAIQKARVRLAALPRTAPTTGFDRLSFDLWPHCREEGYRSAHARNVTKCHDCTKLITGG